MKKREARVSVQTEFFARLFYCLQPGCFIWEDAGVSGILQRGLQRYP
jgi:hypothetical protein